MQNNISKWTIENVFFRRTIVSKNRIFNKIRLNINLLFQISLHNWSTVHTLGPDGFLGVIICFLWRKSANNISWNAFWKLRSISMINYIFLTSIFLLQKKIKKKSPQFSFIEKKNVKYCIISVHNYIFLLQRNKAVV